MTTSLLDGPPALLGSQTPRVLAVPPSVGSSGREVVDLAAGCGLFLDPWQQLVLDGALGEREDGRWAARDVGLIVARQNGKGSVLEARELAGLFLFNEQLIVHTAHQFRTADEAFRRLWGLIRSRPEYEKRVLKTNTSTAGKSIEMRSGQRLLFMTRSSAAGRGFSADCLIYDEAYNLPSATVEASLPTMRARPNPQTWYVSSAPTEDPESDQLRRVRRRGRSSASRLAYFEWSAPEDAASDDPQAWAAANPGLGVRIDVESFDTERDNMTDEGFRREILSIAPDVDRESGAFDVAAWSALADPDAERGDRPVFAVSTAPDRSWSAVAVAWARPDGHTQVMTADYRRGADWVSGRLAELRARWGGVVVDRAARGLVDGADDTTTTDLAVAENALADAVSAGTVRHGNDEPLRIAVREARWRPLGDTRVLDRRGSADISPLVAAALAFRAVTAPPKAAPGRFVSF